MRSAVIKVGVTTIYSVAARGWLHLVFKNWRNEQLNEEECAQERWLIFPILSVHMLKLLQTDSEFPEGPGWQANRCVRLAKSLTEQYFSSGNSSWKS